MQKEMASLANHGPNLCDVENAFMGREKRIDHVGITFHAKRHVFDDGINGEIVFDTLAALSRRVIDMRLLKLFEAFFRFTESRYFAIEMRKDLFFRWNAKAIDVTIGLFR